MSDNDNEQLIQISKEEYDYFKALEHGGKRRFVFYALLIILMCGISTFAGFEIGKSKCVNDFLISEY